MTEALKSSMSFNDGVDALLTFLGVSMASCYVHARGLLVSTCSRQLMLSWTPLQHRPSCLTELYPLLMQVGSWQTPIQSSQTRWTSDRGWRRSWRSTRLPRCRAACNRASSPPRMPAQATALRQQGPSRRPLLRRMSHTR